MLFRANGTGRRVPFKDRLLAPLRLMKGLRWKLRDGSPVGWPEIGIVNLAGAMFGPFNRWRKRRKPLA